MNKQTAVEWFAQQLGITSGTMLDQAKAMELEQIEQAFVDGVDSGLLSDADNYYDLKYKGGEQ